RRLYRDAPSAPPSVAGKNRHQHTNYHTLTEILSYFQYDTMRKFFRRTPELAAVGRVRRSSCLCGAEEASHDKAPTLSAPQHRVGAFFCALAKDRSTHPYVSRAERDRGREIRAHPHRQELQSVACRNLGGEREMRRGSLLER